jgi:cytochrome c peroxidase
MAALCGFACQPQARGRAPLRVFATPFSTEEASPTATDSPFAPLPLALDLDPRKVALGARLYIDRRLSGDGLVACVDCHALDRGGANAEARSTLPGRKPVPVNVPSIFNAAFYFRFGWSGRFEDIGQQLDFAMQSPAAMAGTWGRAVAASADDPAYAREFAALYPEGMSPESVREVLALYSLSLLTPNSRFDRFLRGERTLSADEQRGYDLFREYGCASCHQGIDVGGNMYQHFGVMEDYFANRGQLTEADYGLFNATKREEDKFVFRVPSLRNVALTAPYFHDASAATLEGAVTTMARFQLGRRLGDAERGQIVAFLGTLTGELDGKPLEPAR